MSRKISFLYSDLDDFMSRNGIEVQITNSDGSRSVIQVDCKTLSEMMDGSRIALGTVPEGSRVHLPRMVKLADQ